MRTQRRVGARPGEVGRAAPYSLLGVCVLLGLLAWASRGACAKPQRVSSKGIQYAFDLTPPGQSEPVRLVIDPGRDAWLDAVWGFGDRGTIRSGRGFKWAFVKDSRKGEVYASLYLEIDSLGGQSFDDVADLYRRRLQSLWALAGATFEHVVSEKPTRRLKIGGESTCGRRLVQQVVHNATGAKVSGYTILLPLHGHLIALTGLGGEDVASAALKKLRPLPRGWCENEHRFHCVDYWGVPPAYTYLVLPLPVGYEILPGVQGEDDRDLVNRWRRVVDGGPTETVTFLRLGSARSRGPDRALTQWAWARRSDGVEAEEPAPYKLVASESFRMDYDRSADHGSGMGVLLAWRSDGSLFALHWQTNATDVDAAVRGREDALEELAKIKTWFARYP